MKIHEKYFLQNNLLFIFSCNLKNDINKFIYNNANKNFKVKKKLFFFKII